MWIGVSLMHLRRLRTTGQAAPPCEEHTELQRILGTRAEIRYVAGLAQPVTFGARRPIILLPDTLRAHLPQIERAVLCHELFHVQRRDWVWMLGEEAVRAALWFHPAVWWLISRVQLAREEVVDELVVLATGHRRAYMEALMAFADETPLAPATAFARRRHLFRRIVLISREAVMSSRRVVLSCAVMASIVMAGSWYALRAFPLTEMAGGQERQNEPGPLEKRAKPVTPENPIPRRVHAVTPRYPTEAALGTSAMVTLRLTLDELGRVAEVRRTAVAAIGASGSATAQTDPEAMLAGIDALVTSAAAAVRQWQYEPPAEGPISISVTFSFHPDREPRLVSHHAAFGTTAAPPPPPPPPPPPGPPSWTEGALRVGGNVKPPMKVKDVRAVYPETARAAHVQGIVIIEARIEPDGRVGNARVLRSIPLLDQSALDAVLQWEFVPTLLNGQPVPVIMTVTVQFMTQ